MPAIDPYFSSVSLLLSGDGANGVNNFTDLSIGSRTVTTVGNTQVSTGVKKFGTGSIYFDGVGDYLRCATNMTLSADFTVEFWFNVTALTGYHRFFNNEYEGGKYFYCYYNGTGIVTYNVDSASLTGYGTFTANTWNHFAIVRSGSTTNMYLNGTSVASWNGTTSFPFTYTQLSSDGEEMQGYLDDFRITNGVARYTSNFTPSTTASPTQ
jgi:hypothetical protein